MLKKLIFFSLVLLWASACQTPSSPDSKQSPSVLVSIAPYTYFVERIAGSTLKVSSIIPLNANPHLFEPTPRQVEQIRQSKLWIRIGEPFERKILKVLREQNPNFLALDLSEEIPLLSMSEDDTCMHVENHGSGTHHHPTPDEAKDRHFWMSPKLAKEQAKAIAKNLILLFPDQAALYQNNLQLFLQDLEELDHYITDLLHPFENQAILVSHPAFGYFCHDYKLLQLSIECEGKEPLPQHLTKILKFAERYKVRSVLTQAQYNNQGAEQIAKKLHLPIFMVDPYSTSYIDNLKQIADLIAQKNDQ